MLELTLIRPDYLIRGDSEETAFPRAYRVMRMAVGVACVLELPGTAGIALIDIEERIGKLSSSQVPERFYTLDEVAILAEALAALHRALCDALDDETRPRGPNGERIRWEATEMYVDKRDPERIFELTPDGRVMTVYRRMGLPNFMDEVASLADYFRDATARGREVVILD